MKLINLHLNSVYSFYKSLIDLPTLIKKARASKVETLVLTDTNLCGAMEFYRLCLQARINPVMGLEITLERDFVVMLIAKSWRGYQFLIDFASREEKIKLKELEKTEEHLLIIDHPRLGFFKKTQKPLSLKNFYYPGGPKDDPRVIFVRENKIFSTSQNEALSVLLFTRSDVREDLELEALSFEVRGVDKKIVERTNNLVKDIDFRFPEFEIDIGTFQKNGGGGVERLKKELTKGLEKKFDEFSDLKAVKKRLQHEVKIIDSLGMSDYFLIIWDLVKFAREQGILVGPGRGSVSGSLVAYLLEITEVNPLRYGLYFERFLNHARRNYPDIDIDFEDERRQEIIDYLHQNYGEDRVAQISAFQTVGARNAFRDAGKFLEIEDPEIEGIIQWVDSSKPLEEQLEENHLLRNRVYSSTRNELLFNLAVQIYKLPRNISTHASGIVISKKSLHSKIPTFKTKEGRLQSQYATEALERFGLLKIDVLALRTLSMLRGVLEIIREFYNRTIDTSSISLQDKKVFELLTQGATMNIFQLESWGMRRTLELVSPSTFEHLCDTLALYRPGPLREIHLYAKRKNRQARWIPITPEYEEILKSTYGILIYQEQVMQICIEFIGLSNSEADLFREAISKRDETKLENVSLKVKGLLVERGYTPAIINRIYKNLSQFASYGFNKTHTVAYALLSFKMAFLKANFPLAFYAWVLRNRTLSDTELRDLRVEAANLGVVFLAPQVNTPLLTKASLEKKQLVLPLKIVRGLGVRTIKTLERRIEKIQSFTDILQFVFYWIHDQLPKNELLVLAKSGALEEFVSITKVLENFDYLWYMCSVMNKSNLIDRSNMQDFVLLSQERKWDLEARGQQEVLGGVYSSFPKDMVPQNLIVMRPYAHFERLVMIVKLESLRSKRGQIFLKIRGFDGLVELEIIAFEEIALLREKLKIYSFYNLRIKEWNKLLLLKNVIDQQEFIVESL